MGGRPQYCNHRAADAAPFGVEEASQKYGLQGANERDEDVACTLGWRRMALTSLYFGQQDVLRPESSWRALRARTLVVPPVVGTLVYGEGGDSVARDVFGWSERVARWPFTQVAPAHFAVAKATPREWRSAFERWRSGFKLFKEWEYPVADVQCLRDVGGFLKGLGIIFDDTTRPNRPSQPKPKKESI